MKCFYHNSDLDGICSAAIVKKKFPDCELIGINHGDPFPWDNISEHEEIFMVDFSLPGDEMLELNQACNLVWIDHHKTAIDRLLPQETFTGLQRIGVGACALVWEYLFPELPMPRAVKLLSDWDIWTHTDPQCKPFQYGMWLETHSPEDSIWDSIFEVGLAFESILARGHTVVAYEEQQNTLRATETAFECEFHGLKCIAANMVLNNSNLFDSVWDEAKYDAMISFGYWGSHWTVSMYSTKVDVSKIAVALGGGGHAHSCGFTCQQLPPELGGPE